MKKTPPLGNLSSVWTASTNNPTEATSAETLAYRQDFSTVEVANCDGCDDAFDMPELKKVRRVGRLCKACQILRKAREPLPGLNQ